MAKTAYDEVDIRLQDGTEITLKPLNIGRMKKFMKAYKEFQNLDLENDEDGAFDIYINCAGISLSKELQEMGKVNKTKGEGDEWLSEEYREYLEEVLDMDTIFKIMEVCGGMKLNDPNLLRAAAEAQAGKN